MRAMRFVPLTASYRAEGRPPVAPTCRDVGPAVLSMIPGGHVDPRYRHADVAASHLRVFGRGSLGETFLQKGFPQNSLSPAFPSLRSLSTHLFNQTSEFLRQARSFGIRSEFFHGVAHFSDPVGVFPRGPGYVLLPLVQEDIFLIDHDQ